MMNIGDLVLCNCDFYGYEENYKFSVSFPKLNKVYTIRNIKTIGSFKGLLLEEVINEKVDTEAFGRVEIQFDFNCFTVLPQADLSEIKELL